MKIFKCHHKAGGIALLFLVMLFCIPHSPLFSQVNIHKTVLHGRDAYTIENKLMRLSMLSGGGYIGEARLVSADPDKSVNPMRVVNYETIDPQDYDPSIHNKIYGDGGDNKVMAGYMGQFLCFPYVGGSNSEYEQKLGFPVHGEAATVKWEIQEKITSGNKATLITFADLPLTSYRLTRKLSILPGETVVLVEEEAENLLGVDRPVQWVQHVTFGSPFIDYKKSFVDAPVSKIAFNADAEDAVNENTVDWPLVKMADGTSLDAAIFSKDKTEGTYWAWLLDPDREYSWFTLYHTEYNILIGYIFEKEPNRWVGDWQENGNKTHIPWNGKEVARGLLIGSCPFTPGVKASIERGPIFDTKTWDWIGANQKLSQSYMIFLAEIEKGFNGVAEFRLEKNTIVLTEKETMKEIRIPTKLPFPK